MNRVAGPRSIRKGSSTLTPLRREQIVSHLQSNHQIQVAELASEFKVSDETIRRDLRQLEAAGKLKRVRGGALPSANPIHQAHEERTRAYAAEKKAIAMLARTLIEEGQNLFLAAGTTTLALAKAMTNGPPVHVLTNMLEIAITLSQNRYHDVRLTGGRLNSNNHLLEGEDVIESVEGELFDMAITGTSAIHYEFGLLDHSSFSSTLRRRLRRHTEIMVTLADHSKFNARAPHRTLPLAASEIFVTDLAPNEEFRRLIERAGSRLIHP